MSKGIDYEQAKKEMPKLKAALTRAKKKGPEAVIAAVDHAFDRFNAWGAWPDGWQAWSNARADAELELRKAQYDSFEGKRSKRGGWQG